MGISWSSRRRRNRHERLQHHQNQNQFPPQSPSPTQPSNPPPATLPPPPSPPPQPQQLPLPSPPPSFAFAANAPYPTPQHPPQSPYPSLPPPSHPPHISSYSYHPNPYNNYNYARPMMGQPNYQPYYPNQSNGWAGFRPPAIPPLPPPPAPYVDHQSAKKIKSDVNVQKDTIRVELDEKNPDCHLVSFTLDAEVDGSITIFYFGKEGDNCHFTPLYPEIYMPVRIPFKKGSGQKFRQPSGTGIDLGFFDTDDLSKPLSEEEVFPLVISAESGMGPPEMDEQPKVPLVTTSSAHAQITQAVLVKNHDGHFNVRVTKQILWIDGVRYELREIFGISNLGEATISDTDSGKECVICMTDPKDTAVLPCRHMCMCSECAKALRLQSNKCPICRQPIEELLEIKVDEAQS